MYGQAREPDLCRNFLAKKFKTFHGWGVDDCFLEQLISFVSLSVVNAQYVNRQ